MLIKGDLLMLYIVARIFLMLVCTAFLIISIKKVRKKGMVIISVITLTFALIITVYPVEGAFLEFNTPESACKYVTMSVVKGSVIEGDCAATFFDSEVKSMEKGTDGWKLPQKNSVKQGQQDKSYFVATNKFPDKNILFVCVEDFSEHTVKDSNGTNFQTYRVLVAADGTGKEFFTYYSYAFIALSEIDNYQIFVDGTAVSLNN